MSCGCNKTTLQGKEYCQKCMPDEYHWLVPVSKEPDPFLMDRHHAYIMPNNTIYVLSHDRTQVIDISGNDIDLTPYALKTELANKITELNQKLTTGLEGAKYYEGEGIRIDEDKRIHSTVNLTEVNERIDAIEQAGNSPYKAGTGIEITPDLTINNTVSTDALETRVQALEEKEDQNTTYTAGIGLQLSGTEFSVDPNDLPGLDQIDDLRDKVTALEGKADADTKYTAGNGLILSGTKFSIDDTMLATKEELNHTNTRLTNEEQKNLEQDNRLTTLENDGQPQEQLYNVSTNTVVHTFSGLANCFQIIVDEKNGDNNVFGYITVLYNNQNILDTIPLSQVEVNNLFIVEGKRLIYFITRTDTGYVIDAGDKEPPLVFSSLDSMTVNSALFRENPNKENKHNIEVIEAQSPS